jgi:hypothetical protein
LIERFILQRIRDANFFVRVFRAFDSNLSSFRMLRRKCRNDFFSGTEKRDRCLLVPAVFIFVVSFVVLGFLPVAGVSNFE